MYWVFNCVEDCYEVKFESKKRLIMWLASRTGAYDKWTSCWYDKSAEHIGRAINMNGKDFCRVYDFYGNLSCFLRPYMIIDDNNRIIDIRQWDFDKILSEKDLPRKRKKRMKTNHKRCYGHMRSPKMYQIMSAFADKENAEYMRPKLKNRIPNWLWVDSWAQGSKSWKDQSKKRRQWM